MVVGVGSCQENWNCKKKTEQNTTTPIDMFLILHCIYLIFIEFFHPIFLHYLQSDFAYCTFEYRITNVLFAFKSAVLL